jgi:outer membrane protein TolC
MISREQLQTELDALEAQRDQAIAALNALIGALNLCRALLAEIDKPAEPVDPPTKEPKS